MRHEPQPLTKARNTPLVNLGVVVHDEHVREAVAGPEAQVAKDRGRIRRRRRRARGDRVHLAGEEVDVVLHRVETSRRRRQPCDPVRPDHPAPARWQRQGVEEPTWAAVLRLGPLASLARAHVLGDRDVLTHPEGEEAARLASNSAISVSIREVVKR
jgi:hypothetical protein